MSEPASIKRDGFLLHLCCAPCSPHPIRKLKKDYSLTLYFYNPNIHPEAEYRLRLEEVEKLAKIENLPLLTGDYDKERWMKMALPFKNEPEKGRRCEACIGDRLEQTARVASEVGAKHFGTVLSVSPHKSAVMINGLGKNAETAVGKEGTELAFYEADFKKKEGFKISSKIAGELGFIRQDYCGCLFSRTLKAPVRK